MTSEESRAQDTGKPLWKPLVAVLVIGFFFVGSLIVVVTFVVGSIGYSNHSQRCESGSTVNPAIGAVDDGREPHPVRAGEAVEPRPPLPARAAEQAAHDQHGEGDRDEQEQDAER